MRTAYHLNEDLRVAYRCKTVEFEFFFLWFCNLLIMWMLPAGGATLFLGENLPDGVDAPVLSLEVGTNEDFPQQACAEHHQTGQQEEASGHHQWTVLHDDLVPQQLIDR